MAQKEGILFLGNEFSNYKALAKAMASHWGDSISTIEKPEFLAYFAKSDPYMYGRLELEIKRCHFLETALSMVIYALYPEEGVCIKGTFFKSLKDIAVCMQQNYPKILPSIRTFFKDHCISHVFLSQLPVGYQDSFQDAKFLEEIPFIENNIDNVLVYRYFMNHYTIGMKQNVISGFTTFDFYFRNILNHSKEVFSYVDELSTNADFLVDLAYIHGLNKVFEYTKANNKFFLTIELIKDYITFDIKILLKTGYHLWLADNYNNFNTMGLDAKELFKNYSKMPKVEEAFSKNNEYVIDYCKKLHSMYLTFIEMYEMKMIFPKEEEFVIDRPYGDTYVSVKYLEMNDLNTYVEPVNIIKTEEEIKNIIKENKRIRKNNEREINESAKAAKKQQKLEDFMRPEKYKKTLLNRTFYLALALIASAGILVYPILTIFVDSEIFISDIYGYVTLGACGLGALIALVMFIKNAVAAGTLKKYFGKNKNEDKVEEKIILDNNEDELFDTTSDADFASIENPVSDASAETNESITFADLNYDEQAAVNKKIYYKYEGASAIINILVAFGVSALLYYLLKIKNEFNDILPEFIINNFEEYFMFVLPAAAMIINLIKRRKGFFTFLFTLIIGIGLLVLATYIASII